MRSQTAGKLHHIIISMHLFQSEISRTPGDWMLTAGGDGGAPGDGDGEGGGGDGVTTGGGKAI